MDVSYVSLDLKILKLVFLGQFLIEYGTHCCVVTSKIQKRYDPILIIFKVSSRKIKQFANSKEK